ncbi:MAG: hypothetical protein R3C14_18320 [Caldilineaceae bacterium]
MKATYRFKTRFLHTVLTFLILCGAMLPAAPLYAQSTGIVDHAGGPRARIEVILQVDRAPAPGEVATLTVAATPLVNAPDLQVRWVLPDGGELLGGSTEQMMGPVAAGQRVQVSRQARFAAPGVYQVAAVVGYQPNAAMHLGAAGVLFFTVDGAGHSTASDQDPNAHSPMGETVPTTVETVAQAAGVTQSNDDPCFTVSGTVRRIERTPNQTGYDADVLVPVKFARIEMREEDIVFDDSYGESKTDANGGYSFSFCDDDGLFDDELELYVTVYAERYVGNDLIVYVTDSSYIDETYEFNSQVLADRPAGSYTINLTLTERSSAVFNIVDAIFDAWQFWNISGGATGGDATFADTTKVHWEPGYGDDGSYYDGYITNEITIADDPSDPDEWDDPVIMHEWGHSADDYYGCDDNPGGEHFVNNTVDDPELSWGEGYPDYYQSAVRARNGVVDSSYYLDNYGANVLGAGISINLESRDVDQPMLVTELSEFAIAAMLWDLNDSVTDGQDAVSHGHGLLQSVYTDDKFTSNGFFDDTCTASQFLRAWRDLKKPTDALTAAAITQNIGGSNPFETVAAADANTPDALSQELTLFDQSAQQPNYKWWQQLTLIADQSKSMATAGKFDAVKTVLKEQINDVANDPKGVEFNIYTFNNVSNVVQPVIRNNFFANQITPKIDALTTRNDTDLLCDVGAFHALAQTLAGKRGGNAWLFTDGSPFNAPTVENMVQQLTSHQVKGSFALLGGCPVVPQNLVDVTGAQKKYLGLAANASQSGGIVPYLLAAIGSGGQFLYVDPSKIGDAADILRAQLSHSAGAGRWSEYVSDQPTYLYDKLTSWEYQWIDTSVAAGGTNHGFLSGSINVTLPQPFTFYSAGPYNSTQVFPYGYLTFGATQSGNSQNTTLPKPALPNNALYPLWGDLDWNNPPAVAVANASTSDPAAALTPQVILYSKAEGDWFALETRGFRTNGPERAYQVLLNSTTGEIRYQYANVGTDAGIATIGLENATGTAAVQVSYNDVAGAQNNMGYKFTPVPAQPSRTFTATIDGLMSSVGFLLTGFSGDFDPLDIRYPDNSAVNCNDTANVLCLDLGLVRYVQAKTTGHTGVWRATVSAGPSGAGTFAFSTIGASTVAANSANERTRSTKGQALQVDLGLPVVGQQLDGWFQQPNGRPFGLPFRLYDDGSHGDGQAGDGNFGADPFTPPAAGAAYLWVRGQISGTTFVRSDAVPFTFEPLEVTSLGDGINLGEYTPLEFKVENLADVAHCYDITTRVPQGWTTIWYLTQTEQSQGVCLQAGAAVTKRVDVSMGPVPNNEPSGATGEIMVTFIEKEAGEISDSAIARVTRYRGPDSIVFNESAAADYLRPNGADTRPLSVMVLDDQGVNVADGTPVTFTTSLGTITPTVGTTQAGQVKLTLTAGTTAGEALVTALVESLVATTTVQIQAPLAATIALTGTPLSLAAGVNSATLTATVLDQWHDPVANQMVRIGLSQDGQLGLLGSSEVMTGTTNGAGQLAATFTRAAAATGDLAVRADLLTAQNGQLEPALHDQVTLQLLGANTTEHNVYLPLIQQ